MAPDPDVERTRPPDDRRRGRTLLGISAVVWAVLVLILAAVFVAIVIAEQS